MVPFKELPRRFKSAHTTTRKVWNSLRVLGWEITRDRVLEQLLRERNSKRNRCYNEWQHAREAAVLARSEEICAEISEWTDPPLISVIMPTFNSRQAWLEEAVGSLLCQAYPHWELVVSDDGSTHEETLATLKLLKNRDSRFRVLPPGSNSGISAATNRALASARGQLVTFLDHDDRLAPDALYEVAAAFVREGFDILYSDEDKQDGERYVEPFFKPDFSPDYILSCNYVNHLLVYRRDLLARTGSFRSGFDGAQDYDLLLRASERTHKVVHVDLPLYHWRKVPGSTAEYSGAKSYAHEAGRRSVTEALSRRGENGSVLDTGYAGHYRIRRRLRQDPSVSVLITGRHHPEALRRCLSGILGGECANIETIIVVDEKTSDTVRDYILSLRPDDSVTLSYGHDYCRAMNAAAHAARGTYLLLLNEDVVPVSQDWMDEMLEQAVQPGRGAVGAKLLRPDGRIESAGLILGFPDIFRRAYHGYPRYAAGYFSSLVDTRNVSAVPRACMLIEKRRFFSVGGFDQKNLTEAYCDVDLCLRLSAEGYRSVVTPHVELLRGQSEEQPRDEDCAGRSYMSRHWASVLERDPCYNVHLSREGQTYIVDPVQCGPDGCS